MTHTDATRTGPYHWNNVQDVPGQAFICGYCSVDVGSGKGYLIEDGSSAFIRVCPRCNSPSFFGLDGSQWPGPKVGANVVNLPPDVQAIHEEARNAIAANAPTGSAMLCRKVLMHVAVEKGAKENQSFARYVEHLISERYAPRGAEDWLDYVRDRGNDANHEMMVVARDEAIALLRFTEALLRNVYELPSLVPVKPPSEHIGEQPEETREREPE